MKIYNIEKILLKEFVEEEKEIVEKLKQRKNRFYKLMSEEGFTSVGQGFTRKVFKKENYPFVIKIAKNEEGYEANKREIKIGLGLGEKGKILIDIMPNLYSYDESEKPKWVIFEEVKTIKQCSNEELYKLFPIIKALIHSNKLSRKKFMVFLNNILIEHVLENAEKGKEKQIKSGKHFILWLEDLLLENEGFVKDNESSREFLFIKSDINERAKSIISKRILKGEFDFFYKACKLDVTISNIGVKHGSEAKFSDLVLLDVGVYK